MLLPDLFKEIEFDRYAEMALDMLQQCTVDIAIFDSAGFIVWKNHESNDGINNLSRSIHVFSKNAAEQKCKLINKQVNETYAYCTLGQVAGNEAGYVIFHAIRPDDNMVCHPARLTSVFCNITELIKKDLRNLYEMNNLALELGERYDELAMLRSTDATLTETRESRHILSNYIRKYAEHLDVDYACIWIPQREYFYPAGSMYTANDAAIKRMLLSVATTAHALISVGHDAIGINDKDDPLRKNAEFNINKKILAVPVCKQGDDTYGILISLNSLSKRDFTYSDRTTSEAVCKKVFKYLNSSEDPLTHLYNKTGFEESVWRDSTQSTFSKHLALINITQFNVINGAYGTSIGDEVLKKLAGHLAEKIKCRGFAARIEADQFALLINHSDSIYVEKMLNDLLGSIAKLTFKFEGTIFSIAARCSMVTIQGDNDSLSDCIYSAQLALETSSEDGEKKVIVYKPGNTAMVKRRRQMSMVENIKHALEEDRFALYAQNIHSLTNHHDHYEILIRMLDENGEIVPPNDFIPTAERYRIMTLVDRWVLDHTLKTLDEHEVYKTHQKIKWGINLSGESVSDRSFLDHASKRILDAATSATNLYFEITETAVIENFDNCVSFMHQIHSMGCDFALDDFGSGLSSFSYLKKLAIDYLKVDGSLVKDIVSNELDHTIVSSISAIAKVMGVRTIAEYVENDAIIKVLKTLDIDYAQGFGIMKPMPLELVIEDMQASVKPQIISSM